MSSLKCPQCFSEFWYSSLCSIQQSILCKNGCWVCGLRMNKNTLLGETATWVIFLSLPPQSLKTRLKAIQFVFYPGWCSAPHPLRTARERPRGSRGRIRLIQGPFPFLLQGRRHLLAQLPGVDILCPSCGYCACSPWVKWGECPRVLNFDAPLRWIRT